MESAPALPANRPRSFLRVTLTWLRRAADRGPAEIAGTRAHDAIELALSSPSCQK
jgi:hypothetical protein